MDHSIGKWRRRMRSIRTRNEDLVNRMWSVGTQDLQLRENLVICSSYEWYWSAQYGGIGGLSPANDSFVRRPFANMRFFISMSRFSLIICQHSCSRDRETLPETMIIGRWKGTLSNEIWKVPTTTERRWGHSGLYACCFTDIQPYVRGDPKESNSILSEWRIRRNCCTFNIIAF